MITLIIFSRFFFQNVCFRKILHFCDIEKGYLHKEIRVLFWKPFLVQVNPLKMCIKRITLKVRKNILKEEYEMRVFRFLFYKILKQSFKVWRKKWILNLSLICIYKWSCCSLWLQIFHFSNLSLKYVQRRCFPAYQRYLSARRDWLPCT